MNLVNKDITLNITPGSMPPVLHVSEYDTGRNFIVALIDEDGKPYTIQTGADVEIVGTLNNKYGFTVEPDVVTDTFITFTVTEAMTAYAGKAWCKIKLIEPGSGARPTIQTCAFILAVDRAGVEADTVIGAPGFQEQINEGIAEYFDNDPPFFELPSGGQSGQALLSDGSNGAYWGDVQSGGAGLSDDAKAALLACFRNVAWINDQGQTYYDALYAALYPPADLVSISAAFNQGSAVIYDTDSLDTLKQYLTVTAHMSDSTTRTVTNYTLSGTLTEGTSTITVLYGGKSTTFNCVVSVATPETIVDTISKRQNTTYKTTQYMPGVLCLGYDDTAKTSTFSGKTITEMQFPTTHANAVVSVGVYDLRTNSAPTTTGMNQYTLDADAKIVFDTPISVGANETLTIGNSATDSLGIPFSTNEKELNPLWLPAEATGARTATMLFCAKIVGY